MPCEEGLTEGRSGTLCLVGVCVRERKVLVAVMLLGDLLGVVGVVGVSGLEKRRGHRGLCVNQPELLLHLHLEVMG